MSNSIRIRRSVSIFLINLVMLATAKSSAQTNNQSTLTNQAAPSASSVTTGGTNINYQTNNAYQNEVGFGPGIFCRTPTLFIGGNYGENELDAFDQISNSGNNASNYSANVGLVVPFGSSALESCRRIAALTVVDREISTQLSLLRACASLQKEGIRVDPEQFPLLEKCTANVLGITPKVANSITNTPRSRDVYNGQNSTPSITPKKVPQTTKS